MIVPKKEIEEYIDLVFKGSKAKKLGAYTEFLSTKLYFGNGNSFETSYFKDICMLNKIFAKEELSKGNFDKAISCTARPWDASLLQRTRVIAGKFANHIHQTGPDVKCAK